MDNIVMHRFSIGQAVNFIPRMLHSAAVGEYEIRHLMPALDTDPETPRYQSKMLLKSMSASLPKAT